MSFRYSEVYGSRWDVPKSKTRAAKTLPIISIIQQFWLTTEVSVAWKLANVIPIYKNGQDPGNYRPVILTLVLGNIMEQIVLSVTTWHVQDNQGNRPSQHEFTKAGLVWPTWPPSMTSDMFTGWGKGCACYLNKDFDLSPRAFSWENWHGWVHSSLTEKLAGCPGPGSGGKWSDIQLVAGHWWGSPGLCIWARTF